VSSEEVPRPDSALRVVLEGLPDAVVASDEDGLIVFVNEHAGELFGYSPAELVGQPVAVLWPERVRSDYLRNIRGLFKAGGALRFTREAHGRRRDGGEFMGEMSWGLVETDEGPLMLAVGRDISQRLLTEARLGRRSAENAVVAALGERALSGTDPAALGSQVVRDVGETLKADLTQLFELAAEGRKLRPLAVWGEPDERFGAIQVGLGSHAQAALDSPDALSLSDASGSALRGEGFRSGVAVAVRTPEETFGVLCAYSRNGDALDQEEGAFLKAVANVLASAISRRRMYERVQHQALHDPLTGLANRTLCHDRLAQALARSRRSGKPVAVFFVDLDHFKAVNDRYGHAAGDAVLIEMARRLANAVRPSDTVGRWGGDEFVVICDELDERQAEGLRSRLGAVARTPVETGGAVHRLSASIGFAHGDASTEDPDGLIRAADAAAYQVKQRGGGH
jgi:diguanylate cyclase (GGDEF)-like protein/PAS domain S-box-containing protein